MGDLSPMDRSLIDQAVSAGRVRRIPSGVSGLPLPVWKNGQLIYDAADFSRRGAVAASRNRPTQRIRVAALRRQGASISQIAEAEGISEGAVKSHLKRSGLGVSSLTPEERKAQSRKANAARADVIAANVRRDQVCALLQQGLRQADVMRRFGMSKTMISDDVRILREQGRIAPKGRRS